MSHRRSRSAAVLAAAAVLLAVGGCGTRDAAERGSRETAAEGDARPTLHAERRAPDLAPGLDSLFDRFGETVRDSMAAHDVPGVGIVVADRDRILWTAGYGVRNRETGDPVTPTTVFSVQSISKLFTGLAAARAVEQGILELDAPVAEYLPDFTVHSRVSERPAARMTVRDLLRHAAGFTHEAPVGNNYDAASPSMKAHVESVSDTWLKFPPGTDHAYSNLGYDLVGYIVQRRSGRPYQDYLREELLQPAGMAASFVDTAGQPLCPKCAAGHDEDLVSLPTYVPMAGSGGVRASVEDAGRFLQLLLRFGETADGRRVLGATSFADVYRPTGQARDRGWPEWWFGTGVILQPHPEEGYLLHTHGGGFGYLASLAWLPEHGVGAAVFTNSVDHPQVDADLADAVLDSMVARDLAPTGEAPDVPELASFFVRPPDSAAAEGPKADRGAPIPYRPEWEEYLGTYEVVYGGGFELAPSVDRANLRAEVLKKDGYLQLRHPNSEEPEQLIEHEPGLFFGANSAEALDFRDDPPTLRSIELERVR